MTNFHDPAVIQGDALALVKFMHCLDGVFLWDLFTTMGFEWEYLTGKRKYRWTMVLYSLSRLGALGNVFCNLIGFNVTHEINCQQWIIWNLILAYVSFGCASALIALRVVAIWHHNRVVMALTSGMWLTNIGFLIYGVATVRAVWSPDPAGCVIENTFQARDNITVTVSTDLAQLTLMLVGLLRSRQTNHGIFRYLYVQGLIWLIAATLGEVPSAVFINLNLNDPWNLMFQNLALFTMQICATRMYRALADFNLDIHQYTRDPNGVSDLQFRMPNGDAAATHGTTVLRMHHMGASASKSGNFGISAKSTVIGEEESQVSQKGVLMMRDPSEGV
ncbi:hypothetical protein BC834DRAFT_967354 [Gloeopeniophorella convolvens]|nr:hypothetical protein BC834DRAFT_967354 [Gloeopeniophorella convolvens]